MVNNIMLSAMAWGTSLANSLHSRFQDEAGQDLVEYAVLVGFIGLAAALALVAFFPDGLSVFKAKMTACLSFSSGCKPS